MSVHDFQFTLRLVNGAGSDEMLNDLTVSVLRHVGCAAGVIGELTDEVREGVATGRETGAECDVQFLAHEGQIEIVVSRDDRAVFRTCRRLP